MVEANMGSQVSANNEDVKMNEEPEPLGDIISRLSIPETDYQLVKTSLHPFGLVRATEDVNKKFDFA